MTKTFNEMLAEKDQEYTYRVFSTANIHDPERRERIRIEFMPFEIKSFECESYKPLSTMNTMFPEEPYSPTYSIKVITRYPITKGFLETLAMMVHIHTAHLRIEGEYGPDPVNKPEEIPSDESQKLVGTKRIAEFIKELQDDRKNRDEMSWHREVYETFYTTHRGLQSIVNKPIRNGYYMVEAYQEGGKKYLHAKGPFGNRPEGNPYHDRLRLNNPQIISEEINSGVHEIGILVE